MPVIGQGVEVRLPLMTPLPWGLFTEAVPRIPVIDNYEGKDRTPLGAKFMAMGALSPIIVDFDCDTYGEDTEDKTGNITLTEEDTIAFEMHNLFECSELSGDLSETGSMVRRTFEATLSEALTRIATSNTPTAHTNLQTDSTALAGAANPTEAIGIIEAGLRARISNLAGYIFVPPQHLAYVIADGSVHHMMDEPMAGAPAGMSGGRLVSAAGHAVISDAGHDGDDIFYGTGSMGYSTTNVDMLANGDGMLGELDRTRNIRRWLVENYGLVVLNPAWSVRSTVA